MSVSTLSKVASAEIATDVIPIIIPEKTTAIPMGINAKAMRFIIDRLTDLYPRPIQSLVREVISNAIDATVLLAKSDRKPIEVHSPTHLNATFLVKDYGVGMTLEDVENVYSQYGGSTKMDDFTQIGAYGLGAKSPLAYCAEFHVSTTKNGRTTSFVVSRKPEGNVTTILSEEYTGLESGTSVSIPASSNYQDLNEFEEALNVYKSFSVDVPLMIDGKMTKAPEGFELFDEIVLDEATNTVGRVWIDKKSFLDDTASLLNNGRYNTGVSYLLSGWTYSPNSRHRSGVVVELKPGVVDFSSSRDDITANERFRDLDTRVKEKYTILSQELLDMVMEAYRKMSFQEAMNFVKGVNLHVKNLETVTVSTVSNYYNNSPKLSYTLKMSDFTLESGKNPLKMMADKGRSNGFGAVLFTGDKGSNYRVYAVNNDKKLTENDGIDYYPSLSALGDGNRYGDTTEAMINRVELGEKDSIISILSAQRAQQGYHRDFVREPLVVVTGVTKETAEFIGKNRLPLVRSLFHNSMVILADKPLDKKEKALIEQLFPDGITTYTADKLIEKTIEARTAERKSRVAQTAEEIKVTVLKVTDKFEKHSDYSQTRVSHYNGSLLRGQEISKIIKEKNILLLTEEFNEWEKVFIGAVNHGDTLTGKEIYIVDRKEIRASHMLILADYEYVYVSKNFSHKAKAVVRMAEKRTRYGDFLVESTNELTDADIVSAWKYEHASEVSNSEWKHLNEVAKDNSSVKRVVELLSMDSDLEKTQRFRGMTQMLLENHFDKNVIQMFSAISRLFTDVVNSSRWRMTHREDMMHTVLTNGKDGGIPGVYELVMAEVLKEIEENFAQVLQHNKDSEAAAA